MRISPIILALALLAVAEPALAAVSVPAPSDFALFALGVIGLMVGRRGAKAVRSPDDDGAA